MSQSVQHLYTTDPLEAPPGWSQEKCDCYIYDTQIEGTVLLERWRHPIQNTHVFALNGAEVPGWARDGHHGFVFTAPHGDAVPMYHFFNPDTGDNLYTLDSNGELGPPAYRKVTGTGLFDTFYVLPTPRAGAKKMNRWVIGDQKYCITYSKNSSSGGREVVHRFSVLAANEAAARAIGKAQLDCYNASALLEFQASEPIGVDPGECS